jgi:hypothetical protein
MLCQDVEVGVDGGPVEPLAHLLVVGVRHPQELHAVRPHPGDRAHDVIGEQRHVLDTGTAVEVKVLLDL